MSDRFISATSIMRIKNFGIRTKILAPLQFEPLQQKWPKFFVLKCLIERLHCVHATTVCVHTNTV